MYDCVSLHEDIRASLPEHLAVFPTISLGYHPFHLCDLLLVCKRDNRSNFHHILALRVRWHRADINCGVALDLEYQARWRQVELDP